MSKHIVILIAVIIFSLNLFAQSTIGTNIPDERLPLVSSNPRITEWQNAGCLKQIEENGGMEIDKLFTVPEDLEGIEGNNIGQKIQNIINSTDTTFVNYSLLFYFPPGEYNFTETIEINRDNVVFKGAGAEETTLKFVKQWYYNANGEYERFNFIEVENRSFIGFDNFKIEIRDPTAVGGNLDEGYNGMFIYFENSNNCWVSGVYSYLAPRHHIFVKNSQHIEIRGSYFNDARHHGGGGNGYGIQLFGLQTKYCLIEDNIFRKFRHAIVFSEQANHNVIGYNYERDAHLYYLAFVFPYIEGQICLHGPYQSGQGGFYNLIEGNITGLIEADNEDGGDNEPYNTIFRNKSYDMGIWVVQENDEFNIVNNYFEADGLDESTAGFPWILEGSNHLTKNNKCRDYWGSFWHDNSSEYWQDFSYYHASQPDFIPVEQWPYHPTDSEPDGNNNDNPAKDRWDAGGTKTVLAQWNHININKPDQYDAYFYTNKDPLTGNTQKELIIVYLTYHNQSTPMQVTIEQNNIVIGDWNNKVVNLCGAGYSYLPAKRFVERIILSDVTFDDIVITIDDYDTSDKIITEPYDYGGYPPFPIFHENDINSDMIYATYSGAYSGGVYYSRQHVLKFRLPYYGNISINYDNNFNVFLKDDDGNSLNLITNNYADFNLNGTISVTMPTFEQWGHAINSYVQIYIGPIGFWIGSSVNFDGLIDMGYGYIGQTDPMFCVSEYNGGSGCPTLYSNGDLENNLISLAENQNEDTREYKLLKNRINHEDLSFTVIENQDNINYFDYSGLIAVGHPDNETIGVTGCGEIFSYDLRTEIHIETGRDSIFVIPANDSIIISLDEYTIPQSDEVFLKLTCVKYNSRAMAGKGDIGIGETENRDSTYVFDVVGIYENINTSYSQIPEYLITQGYGNIIIKPSKDIEVHGISFVTDQTRNNNNLDIQSCSIISANSLKNGSDVRSLLLFEDEDYSEFGKNGGFEVTFDSPTFIGDKIDYIFVSKGRYRNLLNEDIISNKLNFSNYPNPFNPETTISFSIPEASKIELSVFNIKGQKVKVLVNDEFEKGTHNIIWNGEDSNDKRVGSGVYFYKLKVNGKEKSVGKCLLLK